ncbi:hypothetical protein Aperf_G00000073946 [Anoplocephala perfoliata]
MLPFICADIPLRVVPFAAKRLSVVSPSTLLRTTPVLSLTSHGKASTSEEVRLLAQNEMQSYWERNLKLKRPLSPHTTVYKPPLCMCTSFMHRSTGIVMALAWMSAGCAGFWYTGNFGAMIDYINSFHFGPTVIYCTKFLLAYPLVYHYTNGMRHLAWDYAIGFNMKTVNLTATTELIVSFLLSLALASI